MDVKSFPFPVDWNVVLPYAKSSEKENRQRRKCGVVLKMKVIPMKLYHYYHAYTEAEGWELIVYEHFIALAKSGLLEQLEEPINVGVVGDVHKRFEVWSLLHRAGISVNILPSGPTTWEQSTLTQMWRRAGRMDGVVLYAHTKGVAHPSERQTQWRRDMTNGVVANWIKCSVIFDVYGCDAVGSYHIVNDGEAQGFAGDGADIVAAQINRDLGTDLPVGPVFPEVGEAIFAGNFWWADWKWVASLNAPQVRSRYDAETWIGGANREGRKPSVFNIEEWRQQQ